MADASVVQRIVRGASVVLLLTATAVVLAGCTGAAAPTSSPTGRASVLESKDVVFRSIGGHDLALDACTPAAVRAAPVVVLVHGGGFTNGRPSDLDFVCRAAAQHGYAAFSVDYRLLPARYPAQVDDVTAAIAWLSRPAQVARFRTDPTRIGLVGASAGATVAAQLAVHTPGTTARPRGLRAVALLSGVYAPISSYAASTALEAQYLGCDLQTVSCRRRARSIYAVNWVDRQDPAMLIVNSTDELAPLPQARRFAEALETRGVAHELLIVPGDAHAEGVLVTDPAADARLFAFLDHQLR